MRIALIVFLPDGHRLPIEADWQGDEIPTAAEVTKAMRDEKLIGPCGERVTWETAHGILVMPASGETAGSTRAITCGSCRAGTVILAPKETESGRIKWEGSCPRCGQDVTLDERDL